MKNLKITINLIVLFVLSLVESTRLNEYVTTFTGNSYIGFMVAIVILLVVVYFEFEQMHDLSRYSTIACIVISLLSYAEPIKKEFENSNKIEKKELIPIPEFQFSGRFWHEKIAYIEQIKIKTEQVKIQNEEIIKWNSEQEKKGIDWFSLGKLLATSLLFSLFFPISVYHTSHRLCDILKSSNLPEDKKIIVLAKVAFTDTPVVSIAQEYDISRDAIYRWMKEFGVEPRSKETKKPKNKSLTDALQSHDSHATHSKIILTGLNT